MHHAYNTCVCVWTPTFHPIITCSRRLFESAWFHTPHTPAHSHTRFIRLFPILFRRQPLILSCPRRFGSCAGGSAASCAVGELPLVLVLVVCEWRALCAQVGALRSRPFLCSQLPRLPYATDVVDLAVFCGRVYPCRRRNKTCVCLTTHVGTVCAATVLPTPLLLHRCSVVLPLRPRWQRDLPV